MKHIYFTFICYTLVCGCATQAQIIADDNARISKLDQSFETIARLGKGPIKVDQNEDLGRYLISSPGKINQILIMLNPKIADGEVIPPGNKVEAKEGVQKVQASVGRYGTYVNMILRSHRLMLRGEIEGALKVLEQIDMDYGETYGSYILRASLAHIEGDKYLAKKYFKLAYDIHPEGIQVKDLKFD